MKLKLILLLTAICIVRSPLGLAEESLSVAKFNPKPIPGINIKAMPEPIINEPPVYMNVDSKGNVYRTKLYRRKNGTYEISDEIVPPETLAKIHSTRTVYLEDLNSQNGSRWQQQGRDKSSTSACPLPTSFTLAGLNGQVYGSQKRLSTNRPAGTTTQWLVYDFWTTNFRQSRSHAGNILFFKEAPNLPNASLHGWGNIIGDNHGSPYGCGSSSRFNSEIEAWYQLIKTYDSNGNLVNTPDWQSKVFPQTCGREMYDGRVLVNTGIPGEPHYVFYPKYRLEMHSNTSHWVAYRIWRFTGSNWVVHKNWTGVDVDSGNWSGGPPNFDESAQGILISAVDNPNVTPTWNLFITNTQCGWF